MPERQPKAGAIPSVSANSSSVPFSGVHSALMSDRAKRTETGGICFRTAWISGFRVSDPPNELVADAFARHARGNQPVVDRLHERCRSAEVKLALRYRQELFQELGGYVSRSVVDLARAVRRCRRAVADMDREVRVPARKGAHMLAERVLVAVSRAVDEMHLTPQSALLDYQVIQHCDHRRQTDAARYQCYRAVGRFIEYELAARRHGFQAEAWSGVVVQEGRDRGVTALTFNRQAVMAAIRHVGDRVGAQHRPFLARDCYPDWQKLTGQRRGERAAIRAPQVKGRDYVTLLLYLDDFERAIGVAVLHRLRRFGVVAGERAGHEGLEMDGKIFGIGKKPGLLRQAGT